MNDRHNDILRIRPQIKKHQTFETMSSEERFQNSTLRPVLKLQNPLLLASFVNYATIHPIQQNAAGNCRHFSDFDF